MVIYAIDAIVMFNDWRAMKEDQLPHIGVTSSARLCVSTTEVRHELLVGPGFQISGPQDPLEKRCLHLLQISLGKNYCVYIYCIY
jgi:hypothetical protein